MTELALHLIEENKKPRAKFLDLGNCSLTEVPEEVGELVWLEALSFSSGFNYEGEWKQFELCYRLPDAVPDAWLAPQLLPPSKPKKLANWEQPGDLVLRYRYEFMPKGLISRLMVRLHRFVPQPDLGWVTGVLFERDGSQVLVEIPPKGGEIAMRARGPERKELLSVIAADLDALNDSFHGLKKRVEKLIPCNCKECQGLSQPRAFEQKELLRRKEYGKLKGRVPWQF